MAPAFPISRMYRGRTKPGESSRINNARLFASTYGYRTIGLARLQTDPKLKTPNSKPDPKLLTAPEAAEPEINTFPQASGPLDIQQDGHSLVLRLRTHRSNRVTGGFLPRCPHHSASGSAGDFSLSLPGLTLANQCSPTELWQTETADLRPLDWVVSPAPVLIKGK
jgi:hypothetical protein